MVCGRGGRGMRESRVGEGGKGGGEWSVALLKRVIDICLLFFASEEFASLIIFLV